MSELYQRNLSYSYGTSSSSNNSSPGGNGGGSGGVSINNKSSLLLLNKSSLSNNGWSSTSCSSSTSNSAAIPGRPQRRRRRRTTTGRRNAYSSNSSNYSIPMDIVVAILLWYTLGVASIATSKVLLSPPITTTTSITSRMSMQPLTLTLQQLTIGSIILYGLIAYRRKKRPDNNTNHSSNQQQQQQPQDTTKSTTITTTTRSSSSSFVLMEIPDCISREMFRAGVCFTMGFVLTNMAFHTAAPSYVETIKAGEPITSSILAVWFRLEHITSSQGMYLTTIMVGVILSTIAQGHNHGSGGSGGGNNTTMTQALISCMIVMISNLCFSFRGLYQKLLQRKLLLLSTSSTTTTTTNPSPPPLLDDLNLQFQMQSTGVCILLGPVLVMELIFPYLQRHGSFSFLSSISSPSSSSWYTTIMTMNGNPESRLLLIQSWLNYAMIAIPNGLAFTGYNLASTYILSRLSVVHHAALNCIRRVFAILVTSLLFQIPLNFLSASGIAVAITGFLAYTHSKANTILTSSTTTTTPTQTELQLLPR